MCCLFLEKDLVTIEIFFLDFSGSQKMRDKMAISAYMFEKSRKGPECLISELWMLSVDGAFGFYLKYTCTKV